MKRRTFLKTAAVGLAAAALPASVQAKQPTLKQIADALKVGVDIAHLRLSHRGKQWDTRAGYFRHAMTGMVMHAMCVTDSGDYTIRLPQWASGKSIPNGKHTVVVRHTAHDVEFLTTWECVNGWPVKKPRLVVAAASAKYDEVREAIG